MSELDGWAVALNGVMLAGSCCDNQTIWDAQNCQDLTVIDCLTATPEGLDLPGLRTEDVTYFQRDGAKHFSDWYEPRTITLTGTIGPADAECDGCTDVREQLNEAVQAWKRSCCDTELVIYPPCPVAHTAENAYPPTDCLGPEFGFGEGPFGEGPFGGGATGCTEVSRNLADNPSAEFDGGWETISGDLTVTWDDTEFYAGTRSLRSEHTSGTSDDLLAIEHTGETGTANIDVTVGETYTASVWLRAGQAGYKALMRLEFNPGGIDADGTEVVLPAGVWTRVSVTAVAPAGQNSVNVFAFAFTETGDPAIDGDYINADACLIEQSDTLNDYYDGDSEPVFNEELEGWYTFAWQGDANESESIKLIQAARFHGSITSGPYGVVGRPRVFQYKWVNRAEQIADFVARFDAIDQRMFILDECGTPGTNTCVHIEPGAQQAGICLTSGEWCLTSGSACFDTIITGEGSSVAPTAVGVGGTEKVYPTITLFGPLISPTVEILNTGEYVGFDGTITDSPITINTENGTAFDDQGNSMTHLLRGSLFLSLYPGNTEWRVLASGLQEEDDPGYATVCWRDTVVNG